MKKYLLISITVFFTIKCFSQVTNWAWVKYGVTNGGSGAAGIACDRYGNSIIVGEYGGATITFGGITLTNNGNNSNGYVVKFDPNGTVLWAKSAGGNSVAVDLNGNIYITGSFSGTSVTFDSFTLTNYGGSDIFIAKYDPSGNVIWAESFGGTTNDFGNGIATDKNGNVYIAGAYNSSSVSFGSTILTNTGGSDVFIVKCDTNGNVLWADNAGGNIYYDGATSISVDTIGNAYITGYYLSNPIMFGSIPLSNLGGMDNFFVAKYNSSGNIQWAKSAGVNDGGRGNSIKTDAIGNSYITGTFGEQTFTLGSITLSNPGVFIVKYNSSGNVVWAKSAGGTSLNAEGYAVDIDEQGNSYITGYFDGTTIVFGNTTLTNTSLADDIYVAEYDSSGNPVWAASCGGTANDNANGIAVDANQNMIIAGNFSSYNISFGGISLVNSSPGTSDAFIAKLKNVTGIEENPLDKGISISPNPFTSQTTISFSTEQTNTTIKITDILGKEIKAINFTGKQCTIEKGTMQAGIYFVQITTSAGSANENVVNRKVVVE